jgi:hypothetical protein
MAEYLLQSVKLHVEQELQRSLEFPKEIKHEISKISESFEKAAKDLKTTTEQEVLAREQNRAAQISSVGSFGLRVIVRHSLTSD